jgi:hypothetical protein
MTYTPVAIRSMAAVNAARSSRSRAPPRPSPGNMPTMRWPLRRAHARISAIDLGRINTAGCAGGPNTTWTTASANCSDGVVSHDLPSNQDAEGGSA